MKKLIILIVLLACGIIAILFDISRNNGIGFTTDAPIVVPNE